MSKEKENIKLVPELRFPEFRYDGKWNQEKLEQLSFKISDGIHSTPKYDPEGEYFFVNGNNLVGGKILITESTKRVSKEEFEKHKRELGSNTILLSINGTIGNLSEYNNEKVVLGKSACYININEDKVNKHFIIYTISTESIRHFFNSELTGSTIKNLSLKTIKNTVINLPLPNEQHKIAATLTSLDDLIAAEKEKLKALQAHKKGLLQQLFPAKGEKVPKLRFGEFSGDWEEKALIDITDKNIKWSFTGGPFGSSLKSSDYVSEENGIRIIQLQNIGDGKFKNSYRIFTSTEKADELLSNNIYPGEIIMSKMGDPVGRACLIPDFHTRYVMSSDGIRVVVDENKFDKYFIYILINSKEFRMKVENSSTGSTRKRIGLSVLKRLSFFVPKNKKEQQKIADCLSSLDGQIATQAEMIEALKEHKKGLMQQMFPNINSKKL